MTGGPVFIHDPKDGSKRLAGTLEFRDGRLWLVKRVERSKHFYRTLHSWGFDKGVIDNLPATSSIEVIDDEGRVYQTTRERLFANAIARDHGHGRQYLLGLEFFDLYDPNVDNAGLPEGSMGQERLF